MPAPMHLARTDTPASERRTAHALVGRSAMDAEIWVLLRKRLDVDTTRLVVREAMLRPCHVCLILCQPRCRVGPLAFCSEACFRFV